MKGRPRRGSGEGGFTMVELLVAVSLSVLLVGIVTMAFQVASSTIKTVQRKLDIYEAARGTLQDLAMALKPSAISERGECFIIKSVAWQDTDDANPNVDNTTPLDPDGMLGGEIFPEESAVSASNTLDKGKYFYSRRECDCLAFYQSTAWGGESTGNLPYVGLTPYQGGLKLEYYGHSALFKGPSDHAEQLANPQRMMIRSYGAYPAASYSGTKTGLPDPFDYTYRFRQWEEFEMRPGREYTGPGQDYLKWRARERPRGDLPTMDFNVSFWHDGMNRFVDPPDYTMIALAPMPRAIKVSLTIWDFEGRAYETFSRIMWLPSGVGGLQTVNGVANQPSKGPGHFRLLGSVVVDQGWAPDPTGYTYNTSDDDWAIATSNTARSGYFNRYKQIVGDVSTDYGGGTNWNLINDWDLYGTTSNPPSSW